MIKIGRNEPCPCGSGKKHKKCCLDLVTHYMKSTQKSNPNPKTNIEDILEKDDAELGLEFLLGKVNLPE